MKNKARIKGNVLRRKGINPELLVKSVYYSYYI